MKRVTPLAPGRTGVPTYYDSTAYWQQRAKRHGRTYVARGGRPSEFQREYAGVAPFLTDMFTRYTKFGDRLLDFGAGTGRFARVWDAMRESTLYEGVDLVKQDDPRVQVITDTSELPKERYAAVMANFVLQHITDPQKFAHWVAELHNCLLPGGVLILVDYDGVVENPDRHMASRRVTEVFQQGTWSDMISIGRYDNHWMGVLVRGAELTPKHYPIHPKVIPVQAKDTVLVDVVPVPRSDWKTTTTVERADWCVVLGGAACVWDDFGRLLRLLPEPLWPGHVVAVNDIGSHWPGRLDHWCTLHPEKMGDWVAARMEIIGSDHYITWSRTPRKGVQRTIKAWGGGASGLLGVQVAIEITGAKKVVLCGIPMNKQPHFIESRVHVPGRVWVSASGHWSGWKQQVNRYKPFTRSMSGRTQELIGSPTAEWLMPELYEMIEVTSVGDSSRRFIPKLRTPDGTD